MDKQKLMSFVEAQQHSKEIPTAMQAEFASRGIDNFIVISSIPCGKLGSDALRMQMTGLTHLEGNLSASLAILKQMDKISTEIKKMIGSRLMEDFEEIEDFILTDNTEEEQDNGNL